MKNIDQFDQYFSLLINPFNIYIDTYGNCFARTLLVDIMTNKAQNTLAEADNSWDSDITDHMDLSDHWLAVETRDREKSRIKRQMKARRELERLQDEKRLRKLVDCWSYDD